MNRVLPLLSLLMKNHSLSVTDVVHADVNSIFDELEAQWQLLTTTIAEPSSKKKRAYIDKFQELLTTAYPFLEDFGNLTSLLNSPFAQLGRRFLMEDRELFYSLYRSSTNNFEQPSTKIKLRIPQNAAKLFNDSPLSVNSQQINHMVEEIRTTGICRWRNFLSDSLELDSVRAGTKETIGHMKTLLHGLQTKISKKQIKQDMYLSYDEELHCKHWYSVKENPNNHLFSRIRSRYDFGYAPAYPHSISSCITR